MVVIRRPFGIQINTMRHYSHWYNGLTVILCTLAWACVDKVRLDAPDQPDSGLLIQGHLTAGNPAKASLYIAELYKYNRNLPRPIGGADVLLENDQGQAMPFKASGDGNYFLQIPNPNPSLAVEVGKKYRISVNIPNGNRYFSDWETLLEGPKIDTMHFTLADKEVRDYDGLIRPFPHINLSIGTPMVNTSGNRVQLLWELLQTYKITDDRGISCYATRKILDDWVPVLDGRTIATDALSSYPLLESPADYRFAEGFYFVITQAAISPSTYGYFDALNQILARKGTFFDPPAGAIQTNIHNPDNPKDLTYGFFYVAKPDTAYLYVSPAAAGNPRPHCPLAPRRMPPPPNACDSCILEAGAKRQKPPWWQ